MFVEKRLRAALLTLGHLSATWPIKTQWEKKAAAVRADDIERCVSIPVGITGECDTWS
ncbi:hypothetical protein WN51_00387 [Melipona quadrifasciata]|uniref:Uncharacterized protein n=1 Tax=Melipona quadrifasciata TaxID=166423 RepID=A0A0M9A0E1_9HYME|nr:hypothetical protein WN51_00387 [Melipona quadrifasciata]